MKLYEINSHLSFLLDEMYVFAEQNEGLIPDNLDSAIEVLQMEKEQKVLDIARYIKGIKAEAEAVKTEIDKLQRRSRSLRNFADRLKMYLKMNLHTGEKYKDNNTIITWRKSEGVLIVDETLIPRDYFKITCTPKLTEIKKVLKAGENITGALLQKRENIIIQ